MAGRHAAQRHPALALRLGKSVSRRGDPRDGAGARGRLQAPRPAGRDRPIRTMPGSPRRSPARFAVMTLLQAARRSGSISRSLPFDGVAASAETIANKTYPFPIRICIVVAERRRRRPRRGSSRICARRPERRSWSRSARRCPNSPSMPANQSFARLSRTVRSIAVGGRRHGGRRHPVELRARRLLRAGLEPAVSHRARGRAARRIRLRAGQDLAVQREPHRRHDRLHPHRWSPDRLRYRRPARRRYRTAGRGPDVARRLADRGARRGGRPGGGRSQPDPAAGPDRHPDAARHRARRRGLRRRAAHSAARAARGDRRARRGAARSAPPDRRDAVGPDGRRRRRPAPSRRSSP